MNTKLTTTTATILALASGVLAADLPVKQVQLFSSGVAFYLHEGTVSGSTTVQLRFKAEQINDILKSMVLQDLDGGEVGVVTYGSKDPVEKTLKSFGVDITARPTFGQLLDQLRGVPVEVAAIKTFTGVILGVEKQRIALNDKNWTEIDVLNVVTDDGIVATPLRDVQRVRLLDEKLDRELREALGVLAGSHDAQKKPVELQFLGQGDRRVRVGYVMESPIWKTTYRLVLDQDDQPLLQGWATVENTTDQDWQEVALTLVSGRPISFVMDLYTPLYVPRPVVEPELYASLRPPTYEGPMIDAEDAKKLAALGYVTGGRGGAREKEDDKLQRERRAGRMFRPTLSAVKQAQVSAAAPITLGEAVGVASLAQAKAAGEVFVYHIRTPVTLPRQQSALLPIVNKPIEAERFSIYNPAVHDKFPLHGLQLTNTTGLVLTQGPITVFDADTYAGDAQVMDLSPGEKRLISYALDLDTEVTVKSEPKPRQLVSVRIQKGTLIARRKHIDQREYVIKNKADRKRAVLVEQDFNPQWALVEPAEAFEQTRDVWRFRKDLQAHSTESLDVRLERYGDERVALMDAGLDDIRIYLRSKVVLPKVVEALQQVATMRTEIDRLTGEKRQRQQQIDGIEADQQRIRQNMQRLPQNSELFVRYVTKLDAQETEIEQLREQIDELKQQETAKRQELQRYLLALNIE